MKCTADNTTQSTPGPTLHPYTASVHAFTLHITVKVCCVSTSMVPQLVIYILQSSNTTAILKWMRSDDEGCVTLRDSSLFNGLSFLQGQQCIHAQRRMKMHYFFSEPPEVIRSSSAACDRFLPAAQNCAIISSLHRATTELSYCTPYYT